MKICEVVKLNELNYPGNIGAMEMFKFYEVATQAEKATMRQLIANKDLDRAWQLLQQVTGMKLQG